MYVSTSPNVTSIMPELSDHTSEFTADCAVSLCVYFIRSKKRGEKKVSPTVFKILYIKHIQQGCVFHILAEFKANNSYAVCNNVASVPQLDIGT